MSITKQYASHKLCMEMRDCGILQKADHTWVYDWLAGEWYPASGRQEYHRHKNTDKPEVCSAFQVTELMDLLPDKSKITKFAGEWNVYKHYMDTNTYHSSTSLADAIASLVINLSKKGKLVL